MRMLLLSLAWMVTLTLIAGLAAIAAAQEEPAPVTFVTGTVVDDSTTEDEGRVTWEQTVEWSDPRLPPTLRA